MNRHARFDCVEAEPRQISAERCIENIGLSPKYPLGCSGGPPCIQDIEVIRPWISARDWDGLGVVPQKLLVIDSLREKRPIRIIPDLNQPRHPMKARKRLSESGGKTS